MKEESALTKEFNSIKQQYPDVLILLKVNDFYETFGEDAVKASKILGTVLTKDFNGRDLTGFPGKFIEPYLHKLIKAGCRVGIYGQK